MPENATTSEASPVSKRGLHGWRAFFAVFGCGTLAAVVVFASIYGVIRATVGSVSGPPSASGNEPNPDPKPMETLEFERIDACRHIQSYSLLRANPANSLTQPDENYEDGPKEGVGRVISDECQWDVRPQEGAADWVFTFSFDAYVEAPQGETMESISKSGFREKLGEIESEYDSLESRGDAEKGNVNSEYFYGELSSDDEGPTYTVVSHSHTAVYVVRLQDVTDPSLRLGDPTSAEGFQSSSRVTVERMGNFFDRMLPDDM